jgi:GGDEF domain-containing protein
MRDTEAPVYRIGGDEIVAVLNNNHHERETIAKELFDRLNRESAQFEWSNPASVMLIHFQNEKLQIADLWIAISDALFDAKVYENRGFVINTYSHASSKNNYQVNVINTLTERLLSFANRLDATHQIWTRSHSFRIALLLKRKSNDRSSRRSGMILYFPFCLSMVMTCASTTILATLRAMIC